MSENSLNSTITNALHALGFRGFHASVYYRGGRAVVEMGNELTGIYDIVRGGFIDWR